MHSSDWVIGLLGPLSASIAARDALWTIMRTIISLYMNRPVSACRTGAGWCTCACRRCRRSSRSRRRSWASGCVAWTGSALRWAPPWPASPCCPSCCTAATPQTGTKLRVGIAFQAHMGPLANQGSTCKRRRAVLPAVQQLQHQQVPGRHSLQTQKQPRKDLTVEHQPCI